MSRARSANPTVRIGSTSSMIITGSQDAGDEETRGTRVALENTYRMEPTKLIRGDTTEAILKEVMEQALDGKTYDPAAANTLGADLANQIKTRVRASVPPRYKVVAFVTIGEESLATLNVTSRCVWNAKFDNFSEYSYKNGSIYAVGMVYGVFVE